MFGTKTPKSRYSKNKRAEKLLGRRGPGQPLFEPSELGYVCPICNDDHPFGETLHFSEYKGMLWCDNCNIDIPSCLCKKYAEPRFTRSKVLAKRDRVKEQTRIFLDTISDALILKNNRKQ